MTSGYNVGENIYLEEAFNDLCGFTEAEIAAVLERLAAEGGSWSPAEALDLMRTFYNGYCFSETGGERLYNPTLSLYFLKALQTKGRYPRADAGRKSGDGPQQAALYRRACPMGKSADSGPEWRSRRDHSATGPALRRGGCAGRRSRISRSWPRCSTTLGC